MNTLYEHCKNNPDLRAIQPWQSNIVILCPDFWQMDEGPVHYLCPQKNARTGVMMPNQPFLQMNRQTSFVHEMVHMYLGHTSTPETSPETYKVGDAVALDEELSMKNPSNYAFFYAGK